MFTKTSLAATISRVRPELALQSRAQPVSVTPPENSRKVGGIEMMLAQNYNNEDPTDWY